MMYLIITAGICSLICLVLVARLILKDTKDYAKPEMLKKPYVFKHVKELIKGDEFTHDDAQSLIIEDPQLDLTGLSSRAKKAITSTGAFKVSDLDMGTLKYCLKHTKGVGPKTLTEINAWSVAEYGIKILD